MAPFRSLPPMPSLVVFEAAARHQSFTRAAEELGLTQGAVSHQIKLLETDIGTPLFLRLPRRTPLTAEGYRFVEVVRDSLQRITDTASSLRRRHDNPVLTVSVLPGFAYQWLFPRLLRFEDRYPGIELRFVASSELADFSTGEIDAAIRYGRGRYAGLHVEQILGEEMMFPVCSPRLLAENPPLRHPEDLAHHVLLHDEVLRIGGVQPGWAAWLQAAKTKTVDAKSGRRFGLSIATVAAAIEGMGVALGRTALVHDSVRAERLACPFGPIVPSGFNYYFICPHRQVEDTKIAKFRAWLFDEASRALEIMPSKRPAQI